MSFGSLVGSKKSLEYRKPAFEFLLSTHKPLIVLWFLKISAVYLRTGRVKSYSPYGLRLFSFRAAALRLSDTSVLS